MYQRSASDIMSTNFAISLTVQKRNIDIYNLIIGLKNNNKSITVPVFNNTLEKYSLQNFIYLKIITVAYLEV